MSGPAKTNATRILESQGIEYELRAYDVDPEDLSAETVARKIGLPHEEVFKTLLAQGDRNGYCFAVVPAGTELDMKALARLTGDRALRLAPLSEVEPLTGYVRGGVTVFGAKKPYPVFADESILLLERISVSAGLRGLQILLSSGDYVRASQATLGPIARA